jgi:hypothetical protein
MRCAARSSPGLPGWQPLRQAGSPALASWAAQKVRVRARLRLGPPWGWQSLGALLAPKTVAVVGASRSRTSVGGEIFANLVSRPFAGPVYPVNATASHIQGVRAYQCIAEVPDTVDLVRFQNSIVAEHRETRGICAASRRRYGGRSAVRRASSVPHPAGLELAGSP